MPGSPLIVVQVDVIFSLPDEVTVEIPVLEELRKGSICSKYIINRVSSSVLILELGDPKPPVKWRLNRFEELTNLSMVAKGTKIEHPVVDKTREWQIAKGRIELATESSPDLSSIQGNAVDQQKDSLQSVGAWNMGLWLLPDPSRAKLHFLDSSNTLIHGITRLASAMMDCSCFKNELASQRTKWSDKYMDAHGIFYKADKWLLEKGRKIFRFLHFQVMELDSCMR
ncbi:hypothetical protein Ancab_007848 [Ancistrocladus abbreviatus]